jgi:hypothetical protein
MQEKIQETKNQVRKVTCVKNQKKRWYLKAQRYFINYYCSIFQTAAARSPPIIGATQKSQSWVRAVPPTIIAGPKLLAGFTDVPVTGIPTR